LSEQAGEPAEEKKRGKTGTKPGMTAARKTLRDAAIVALVHAGEPRKDVAKKYGLTPRTVERILTEYAQRPSAVGSLPMAILERAIRDYEAQMAMFRAVAEDTVDRAPAVCVGALKGYADAQERYLRLLTDVGKLPDNLELFRQEADMRRIAERTAEALAAAERGEVTVSEVIEVFERAAAQRSMDRVWDAAPGEVRDLPVGDQEEAGDG